MNLIVDCEKWLFSVFRKKIRSLSSCHDKREQKVFMFLFSVSKILNRKEKASQYEST